MFRPLVIAVALIAASPLHAQPKDFPLAPAIECSPRAGLPNFLKKIATKDAEVRIAYLGGSITAQAGWRPKTLAHFKQAYPDARISEINAAIGGTGSDLGVFRLAHDVLDHKPDLLFIEFAVNDGGQAPEKIFKCMEGIVRQTWRALPLCDICFVYTITDTLAPPLMEGKFPRAASAMETVAGYYSIPSIHLAIDVARLAKEGKLLWKSPLPKTDDEKAKMGGKIAFANDGVHPYPETGHELYFQAILRSLPAVEKASTRPGPHAIDKPLTEGNFEDAKMIPLDRLKLPAAFSKLDPAKDKLARQFGPRLGQIYRTNQAGQTITFKFKGRHAAIYDIIGPDCGQVIVTVDDGKPTIVRRFDAYSTYHRLATMPIATDLPDIVHTVKLDLHADQPDKAKILAQRNEKMDKPERFNDTAWYPGALLLLGELVD